MEFTEYDLNMPLFDLDGFNGDALHLDNQLFPQISPYPGDLPIAGSETSWLETLEQRDSIKPNPPPQTSQVEPLRQPSERRSRTTKRGPRSSTTGRSTSDHRSVLKRCPHCQKLEQSRNLARHVKSHAKPKSGSSSTAGSSNIPAPSKPPVPFKNPLERQTQSEFAVPSMRNKRPRLSKSTVSDLDLEKAADSMIRVRKEFGADIEGLRTVARSTQPHISDEAQRAMAIAIRKMSSQTHELARELRTEATFRASVANLATRTLDVHVPTSALLLPRISLSGEGFRPPLSPPALPHGNPSGSDLSSEVPPVTQDIAARQFGSTRSASKTSSVGSVTRSCTVMLGRRCDIEMTVAEPVAATSKSPPKISVPTQAPSGEPRQTKRPDSRPYLCKARSPEILPGDTRLIEFTSRAHTTALLKAASRRLSSWKARHLFARAERHRQQALSVSREIFRSQVTAPTSSGRPIPRLMDLVLAAPGPSDLTSAATIGRHGIPPLLSSDFRLPAPSSMSLPPIDHYAPQSLECYWTAEGARNTALTYAFQSRRAPCWMP